jgi:hypothetical protein
LKTVKPRYPWAFGSKETTMEGKPHMLRMHEVQNRTMDA